MSIISEDPLQNFFVCKVKICNKRGLHARASARFVKLAESYNASITVEKDGLTVLGNSIMGLMMLAATMDSFITIKATGKEAEEAVHALESFACNYFGEEG